MSNLSADIVRRRCVCRKLNFLDNDDIPVSSCSAVR